MLMGAHIHTGLGHMCVTLIHDHYRVVSAWKPKQRDMHTRPVFSALE